MLKQYVNNLHKQLQIGKYVKFVDGFYETDDPKLQAQIEGTNAFGPSIHYKDSLEEMARLGREREEQGASERIKERRRITQEIADEKEAEVQSKAVARAQEEAEAEEQELLAEARREAEEAREAEEDADKGKSAENKGKGKGKGKGKKVA